MKYNRNAMTLIKGLLRRALALLLLQPALTLAADSEVFVQTSHSIMATRSVFSPDGKHIAVCDGAGRVALWDAASGRKIRELTRHTGLCMGIAWSADSAAFASSGGPRSGNEIAWHRVRDGARMAELLGHKGFIQDLALSRDGKALWSLGESDGLKLWPVRANLPPQAAVAPETKPLREITVELPGTPAAELASLAIDPKTDRVWVARTDGKIIEINVAAGEAPRQKLLWQGPERIAALSVSPQGDLLAVTFGAMMGATERGVTLLSTASGEVLTTLYAPRLDKPGVTLSATFSPDGAHIAAVSMVDMQALLSGPSTALQPQETLTVWSRKGDVLAHTRKEGRVNGLPFLTTQIRFDAKGERLAVAAWDINPRVYTLARGQLTLTHTLEGRGLAARMLTAAKDTPLMITADTQAAGTRSTTTITGEEIRREFGSGTDWTAAREQRLKEVYGTRANLAHVDRASIWNLQTGRLERVVNWQRAPVTQLALNAAGEIVSYAPVFPSTILLSPLKSNLIREARLDPRDAQGAFRLNHFDPEPSARNAMDLFHAPAGSAEQNVASTLHTTRVVGSKSGRWVALAMQPTGEGANAKRIGHKLVVMEHDAGVYEHRLNLDLPGEVRAMAIPANELRLWLICGVAGLAYQGDYEAKLIAIDLPSGARAGEWALRKGATPDVLVVSADGASAYTSGEPRVESWRVGANDAQTRYAASPDSRAVTALTLSEDGTILVAADATGHISAWDTREGKPLWTRRFAGASPQTLGFVAQDTRVAAATADGTVHLLNASSGEPIARMIRFDNEEWITITPEGYFVASPNGDRWLNVRVDDKVYGIDQFFDVFYRPDIVERRLAGEDITPLITTTLEEALREPPPQAVISVRAGSSDRARIAVAATSGGGRVGEVRIFHNGKLIATRNAPVPVAAPVATAAAGTTATRSATMLTRALTGVTEAQRAAKAQSSPLEKLNDEIDVSLVPGENHFTVVAFNGANTLNARPVTREITANLPAEPRRIVLLSMGINEYAKSADVDNLRYAVKDADDFAKEITATLAAAAPDTAFVRINLRDRDATRERFLRTFDELARTLKPTDIFIWFVASHGTLDDSAQYGIIPHDWDGKPDPRSLVSASEILEASRKLPPLTQFFVFDTCHAGGLNSLAHGLYDARLAVLARNMGLHIFASASAAEEAIDGYQGNGLFTHTLLKGLRSGDADIDGDKKISVSELGRYASRETARIAQGTFRHAQQPVVMSYGKDWTLHVLRDAGAAP